MCDSNNVVHGQNVAGELREPPASAAHGAMIRLITCSVQTFAELQQCLVEIVLRQRWPEDIPAAIRLSELSQIASTFGDPQLGGHEHPRVLLCQLSPVGTSSHS
eukprot:6781537-Prymnesium_polylepis.4